MQLRPGRGGRGLMRLAFRSELSGEVALNSNESGRMFSQITRPIERPRMGSVGEKGQMKSKKITNTATRRVSGPDYINQHSLSPVLMPHSAKPPVSQISRFIPVCAGRLFPSAVLHFHILFSLMYNSFLSPTSSLVFGLFFPILRRVTSRLRAIRRNCRRYTAKMILTAFGPLAATIPSPSLKAAPLNSNK